VWGGLYPGSPRANAFSERRVKNAWQVFCTRTLTGDSVPTNYIMSHIRQARRSATDLIIADHSGSDGRRGHNCKCGHGCAASFFAASITSRA
jgi:hypothetical protein